MQRERLELIDFLKGFSIFTIVIFHLIGIIKGSLPPVVVKMSNLGGAGVHLFLLCSGFGLYLSYLNKPLSYGTFLKKRFSKVYIPYIIVVLMSTLFPFMYTNSDRIIALLSHIFLFKMFVPNYEQSFGTQFWFISTIIQFYIVFYGLVYIKQKLDNKFFISVSVLISLTWWILVAIIGKADIRIWNSFFLQYVWEFSLGMILADIYCHRDKSEYEKYLPNKIMLLFISIIGISILGITGLKSETFKLFNDIPALFGYGAFSIFLYSIHIKVINRAILFISKFSYEWYLVHIFVFFCTFQILKELPIIISSLIAIILSIIASYWYQKLLFKYLPKIINHTSSKQLILESKKV